VAGLDLEAWKDTRHAAPRTQTSKIRLAQSPWLITMARNALRYRQRAYHFAYSLWHETFQIDFDFITMS
jgi:hypothetical protein